MDNSVKNFYKKDNNDPEYYKKYEREHSPRLNFIVEHFKLKEIKDKVVGDFGCGAGFLLSRLDNNNKKYGIDGVEFDKDNFLCDFTYYLMDLDEDWSQLGLSNEPEFKDFFDVSFCFETLEHLASPYNALCNMKWTTKKNAPIYVSIPDVRVTHNVVYPGLIFPHTNFEEFLLQMALPIEEHVVFEGDWPDRIWKCRNASWAEKKLKYPKAESKFINATPIEATNL